MIRTATIPVNTGRTDTALKLLVAGVASVRSVESRTQQGASTSLQGSGIGYTFSVKSTRRVKACGGIQRHISGIYMSLIKETAFRGS
jgi:hypothetical protein